MLLDSLKFLARHALATPGLWQTPVAGDAKRALLQLKHLYNQGKRGLRVFSKGSRQLDPALVSTWGALVRLGRADGGVTTLGPGGASTHASQIPATQLPPRLQLRFGGFGRRSAGPTSPGGLLDACMPYLT